MDHCREMIDLPLRPARTMSGRSATILTLILIASVCVSCIQASAEDADLVIDSDVTWESNEVIDGAIRISDGGSLTISGIDVSVASGSSIVVDNGGSLIVEDSHIAATSPPTGITSYGYWDEGKRGSFRVPSDGLDGGFSLTIHSVGGASYYGSQAFVGDAEPISMNGTEHTFDFLDTVEGEIWIGLIGYGFSSVSISSVSVDTGTAQFAIDGIDLDSVNMMAAGDQGFEISISGHMAIDDSVIEGGGISLGEYGSLDSDGGTFDRVGPIQISSDGASIDLYGESVFVDSLDDHDIRGTPHCDIRWADSVIGSGDSERSGGLTDRWERMVVDQRLTFDAVGVVFEIDGMGPDEGTSFQSFSDSEGVGIVDGGGERTVQIRWSDGTWWNESAIINIVSYRTGWNPEGSGIDDYGGDSIPLTWNQEQKVDQFVPDVEWDSIQIVGEGEASTSQSVAVLAEFANRGSAAASFYITCDIVETGMQADIGGFQGVVVGAGESTEIQFGWRGGEVGTFSIDCEILTPTQLVDDGSFGGGSMTAGPVVWVEPTEDEGLPMTPILVALAVGVGIVSLWAYRKASSIEEDQFEDDELDEY